MPTSYDSVRYTSLQGRTVLVTGGASGIGAEMVTAFAAQGANVALIDIDADAGRKVAASTGAMFADCDITDIPALRSAIANVERACGGIDDEVRPGAAVAFIRGEKQRHAGHMACIEPELQRLQVDELLVLLR